MNGLIDSLIGGKADYSNRPGVEIEAKLRHDLRTPLNAIIGYSEMILEEAEELHEPALEEDVRVMLAAAAELLAHIDAIAGLSRARDFRGPRSATPVGIDAVGLERSLVKTEHDVPPASAAEYSSSMTSRATAISSRAACSMTAIRSLLPNPACPRWRAWGNRSSTWFCWTYSCRT